MNKISSLLILLLLVFACKDDAPRDFIVLSGKIKNKNSDSLVVTAKSGFKKVIKVNGDGLFKDTLRSSAGSFNVFDGKEYSYLYAKIGDEIEMTFDTKKFNKSIKFSGKGAITSNFKAKLNLKQDSLVNNDSIFKLSSTEFKKKIATIRDNFTKTIDTTKALDTLFVKDQKEGFDGFLIYLEKIHREKNTIEQQLQQGMDSPKFIGYETVDGKKVALDDLIGDKYLLIDLWASWCEPCKYELPYLKQVQSAYKDLIDFVSISVDKVEDKEKWIKLVKENDLTGIQLFANGDTKFMKDYKVTSIPRFILLNPEGIIVTPNAPKPSDKKLIDIFDDLYIVSKDSVQ